MFSGLYLVWSSHKFISYLNSVLRFSSVLTLSSVSLTVLLKKKDSFTCLLKFITYMFFIRTFYGSVQRTPVGQSDVVMLFCPKLMFNYVRLYTSMEAAVPYLLTSNQASLLPLPLHLYLTRVCLSF